MRTGEAIPPAHTATPPALGSAERHPASGAGLSRCPWRAAPLPAWQTSPPPWAYRPPQGGVTLPGLLRQPLGETAPRVGHSVRLPRCLLPPSGSHVFVPLSPALRGSTETSRTSGSPFLWAWELVPIGPSAVGPERPPRGHRRDGQEASGSLVHLCIPRVQRRAWP